MTSNNNWEKDFNERFPLPKILALSGGKGVERDLILQFIRTLMREEKSKSYAEGQSDGMSFQQDLLREIEKEVEKMRYSPAALDTSEASERVMSAVNQTVDEFIALIRSHMKE